MRKRAVNLEGVVDRLRLRFAALELGGLPVFLQPAGRPGRAAGDDDVPAGPRSRRAEPVPRPTAARRSYVAGGRIAAMVELIGR